MEPAEIQDAARLAARVPSNTTLSPRDVEVGPAWLDLRAESTRIAVQRVGMITEALSTCLALQESACLLVTTRVAALDAAAIRAAASLMTHEQQSLGVAVVRGENVLDRIEEFAIAQRDLRQEMPAGELIRNLMRRNPVGALAQVPSVVLHDAREAGAKVVVSLTAEALTLRESGQPDPKDTPSGNILVTTPTAYAVNALVTGHRSSQGLPEELLAILPEGVECTLTPAGDALILAVRSEDPKALREACRCCHLVLDGVSVRLSDATTTQTQDWPTSVPPEMLEFGYDLRPAADWLAGSAGDTP